MSIPAAILKAHITESRDADLFGWLPDIAIRRYYADAHVQEQVGKIGADGMIAPTFPFPNFKAAYWSGSKFTQRKYISSRYEWAYGYSLLAEKIARHPAAVSQPVIIDLSAGDGILGSHIAALRPCSIVNVDIADLSFCDELQTRHGIPHRCVRLDLSRDDLSPILEAAAEFTGPRIVISRAGLYPYLDVTGLERLFNFLTGPAGVVGGGHWEHVGHHTQTYRLLISPRFNLAPKVSEFWRDPVNDPLAFMAGNSERLGIEVVERVEVWPNFPFLVLPVSAFWPSYLSWERKTDGRV